MIGVVVVVAVGVVAVGVVVVGVVVVVAVGVIAVGVVVVGVVVVGVVAVGVVVVGVVVVGIVFAGGGFLWVEAGLFRTCDCKVISLFVVNTSMLALCGIVIFGRAEDGVVERIGERGASCSGFARESCSGFTNWVFVVVHFSLQVLLNKNWYNKTDISTPN